MSPVGFIMQCCEVDPGIRELPGHERHVLPDDDLRLLVVQA